MTDIILLAGVADLRTTRFQAALNKAGLPPASVISYHDIAASFDSLLPLCSPLTSAVLRIDSSGSDLQALQVILEKGAAVLEAENSSYYWSTQQITDAIGQKGRLIPPHQYYAGLSVLFNGIKKLTSKERPKLTYMNPIEDSLLMSDKALCHAYLQAHDIPVAPALTTSLAPVCSYDDLRDRMQQQGTPRVFVKLRHGAGAAGIIALEASAHRVQARTTVECVKTAQGLTLYNSLRIRKSTHEASIKALINQLCQMDVHVECWIPKAQVGGNSVDLRILVIDGEVCHQVLRMSRSPITNLHLLNQRSEVTPLRQKMTDDAWQSLMMTCVSVAGLFPNCTYVALDVAVDISLKHHVVLEVNAFGDFIKDVWHKGLSPYECEVQALQRLV